MSTRVVQVIVSDEARTGRGVPSDPVRAVYQLWTLDGTLIVDSETNGDYVARSLLRLLIQEADQ